MFRKDMLYSVYRIDPHTRVRWIFRTSWVSWGREIRGSEILRETSYCYNIYVIAKQITKNLVKDEFSFENCINLYNCN